MLSMKSYFAIFSRGVDNRSELCCRVRSRLIAGVVVFAAITPDLRDGILLNIVDIARIFQIVALSVQAQRFSTTHGRCCFKFYLKAIKRLNQ
jgi:hypothetical protein